MNEIEKKGKRPTTYVGPKSCGQRTAYCTCTASQHHYASLRLTRLERRPIHQPTSPPMTTSPPRTAPEFMSLLMEPGTTDAVIGNSTGAVLTTRTTLPEPGVSRTQKNGRSQPSSVYSSMTCLLLFGPWRSSMRALSGRPSVLRRTWMLSTDGSKGYVRRAPPWMVVEEARHSGE